MALIECSECKTEVSDKAPACPKCGAPIHPMVGDSRNVQLGKGCLGVVAMVVGAFAVLGIVIAVLTPKAPPVPLIKASIVVVGSEMLITNKSTDNYSECFVQFDADGTMYYIRHVDIAPGQMVSLNLREFHSLSDAYFDGRHVVRSDNVECNTPTGKVSGGRENE